MKIDWKKICSLGIVLIVGLVVVNATFAAPDTDQPSTNPSTPATENAEGDEDTSGTAETTETGEEAKDLGSSQEEEVGQTYPKGKLLQTALNFFSLILGFVQLTIATILNFAMNILDGLIEKSNVITELQAVKNGWAAVRDLCNMFFIFILLAIAVMTVFTGTEGTSYSVKRALPMLIVAVLTINFSFLMCKVILDGANIAMRSFAISGSEESGPAGVISKFLGINELGFVEPPPARTSSISGEPRKTNLVGEGKLQKKWQRDARVNIYKTEEDAIRAAALPNRETAIARGIPPFSTVGDVVATSYISVSPEDAQRWGISSDSVLLVSRSGAIAEGFQLRLLDARSGISLSSQYYVAVGDSVENGRIVFVDEYNAPSNRVEKISVETRGTINEYDLGVLDIDPYNADASAELIYAQFISIVFVVIATIAFLVIDIVFIGRYVMLVFLIVLAPLPFLLMILPATKKFASMWWQKFLKWAFIGVIITFFLWLIPALNISPQGGGVWDVKDVSTTADQPIKVLYPKYLSGGMTQAEFVTGLLEFVLLIGFLIAAGWAAVTLGETFGKVAMAIPRFAKRIAKGAGKLALKGTKAGAAMTGVPGGVKARARDIMGGFGRVRQQREAAVREFLGEPGARTAEVLRQATGMRKDMDEKGLLTTPGQRKDFFGDQKTGSVGYLAGALAMAENGELEEDQINEVAGRFGDRKEYVESLLRDKNKKKRPSTRFPKYVRDEAGNLVIDKERGGKIRSMYGNMTSAQLAEVKPDEFKDENAQLGVSLDEVIKLSPGTRNLIAGQIEAKIGELNFDLGKAQPGSAAFNELKNTVGELRKRHAVVSGNPEASYTKISPSSKAEADKELTTFVQTVEPKFLADMSSKVLSSLAPRMNVGALNMIGQQKGISPDKLKSVVKSINEKGKNEIINYLRMNEFWSPYQKEHTGEGSKARPPQQFE